MHLSPKTQEDYSSFAIIILFALLGKVFYDFKSLERFNYPLLIKIIYMILIMISLVVIFHAGEVKYVIKQTKIEDYFNKFKPI